MSDNLMPGSDAFLNAQEDAINAWEYAVDRAWEHLADEAPDGVDWDVISDEQDADGAFVFIFRDAGGYEFSTTINPWLRWDDEPDYWDYES